MSWGDYVRPSMQHIEGPHVGVFSALHNPGQALDSSERSHRPRTAAVCPHTAFTILAPLLYAPLLYAPHCCRVSAVLYADTVNADSS